MSKQTARATRARRAPMADPAFSASWARTRVRQEMLRAPAAYQVNIPRRLVPTRVKLAVPTPLIQTQDLQLRTPAQHVLQTRPRLGVACRKIPVCVCEGMKFRVHGASARVKDVRRVNMETRPVLAQTANRAHFQERKERAALTRVGRAFWGKLPSQAARRQ